MNRAKIYSNRRKVYVSFDVAHIHSRRQRTWPKLKVKENSVDNEVISVVVTHTLMGTTPTDMKNTNGNRRPVVFLFI
jgi:hypothetical protein